MTSDPGTGLPAGFRALDLADHHCFACGSLNEHGIRLDLHVEPGRAWTAVELPARFEGWAGIAHGGILSTILDEVMAWAVIGQGTWGLTARMTVDFRRPVPVGRAIRADGRVTRTTRRLVETAAEIVDVAAGDVLAAATGTYVAVDPAHRDELEERYGLRPGVIGPSPDPVVAR